MATSKAAYLAGKVIGHNNAITKQDVSSYLYSEDSFDTMKVLVRKGNHKDTDVILKVTGSTVCGLDLHLHHGAVVQIADGDILGHEFRGIVELVGLAVNKVKTTGIFRYSHLKSEFGGGQTEYICVPLGDVNLLGISDNIMDEKALNVSGILCTSYHAVKDTTVYQGDQVAIFGAGPIGQMANIFAFREGASEIIFVDTESRLTFMKQRFSTEHNDKLLLIDNKTQPHGIASKETVVSKLKDICDGRGPAVAFECAAGEMLNEMIKRVRNHSHCSITGVYVAYLSTYLDCSIEMLNTNRLRRNHFNVGSLMQRGIRLIGNGQAPVHKYYEEMLAKIQKDELDLLQMVSHRVRLEDLDKVYAN
ncbi:hypothetical protein TrVGV298_001396 [Trichoderma virens]|nr:hypothetical protein TrVGV298_001396 [Trichoderma virens]